MRLYENVWDCMKLHKIVWYCIKMYEIVWDCLKMYEIVWYFMRLYDIVLHVYLINWIYKFLKLAEIFLENLLCFCGSYVTSGLSEPPALYLLYLLYVIVWDCMKLHKIVWYCMKMLCYVTSGLSEPPALYLLLSDRRSPPAIPNMVSTIALACCLLRENKACYMLHVTPQKISNMVSTIACYLLKENKACYT